jgi:ParB family chromosome partitioning protein
MATAVQKITLSSSRDIPFNKLVLSQSNVRRVKAGVSIEDLAESIARRGLIQSLTSGRSSTPRAPRPACSRCRPAAAATGARTAGEAEAPGQDRAGALRRARRQQRHPRRGGLAGREHRARAAASARPVPRLPGHARQGHDRGGHRRRLLRPVTVVKQRLRLASVSPTLLEIYAEDGMTLEQLMAFTVTPTMPVRSRSGRRSRILAEGALSDPPHADRDHGARLRQAGQFVGSKPMRRPAASCCATCSSPTTAAGCRTRPARPPGRREAEGHRREIAAEGWKWIEVAVSFPYGHDAACANCRHARSI